jgi:hypothetical protein
MSCGNPQMRIAPSQQPSQPKSTCGGGNATQEHYVRERFAQGTQPPWTKPTAYLNLGQTWGQQKDFQL